MTTTTTKPVETVVPAAGNQVRLAAAAQQMYAAETFLHTARQAGFDEWVSVAYQHLRAAIAEHVACLYEGPTNQSVATTRPQEMMMVTNQAPDHRANIDELQLIFPRVPARIVTAVFEANVPVTRTLVEAVEASRQRLVDALAE